MYQTSPHSDDLLNAFRSAGQCKCLKAAAHIWQINQASVVRFLPYQEALAYHDNARLARSIGLETVSTHAGRVNAAICELYCPQADDEIKDDPAILVMSAAPGQPLDQFKKKFNKDRRQQLYSTVAPRLFAGSLLTMMTDPNDTNIYMSEFSDRTVLIDFQEGLATLETVSVEEQLNAFIASPARFPHFQVDMDCGELEDLTKVMLKTCRTHLQQKENADLAHYGSEIEARGREFLTILKNTY